MQSRETLNAGVRDLASIEIELAQLRHAGDDGNGRVRYLSAEQVEFAHGMQVRKLSHSGVGYAHAVEIEFFETGEPGDLFQAFIGHQSVPKIEPAQMMHAGEAGHSGIAESGIDQMERIQIDKWRKAVLFHLALGAAQFLQLGK